MMKSSLALKLMRLRRGCCAELLADRRGLAAVEFAMILPLMLVTLFGLIGVTSAISIDRKVTLISRTLSDLTSQGTKVTTGPNSDIQNFFAIGRFMLTPYNPKSNSFSGGPLLQTISEVYVDPVTSAVRVQWSWGDVQRAIGSPVPEMPKDLISIDPATLKPVANQYFILSEVSYRYSPAILPGVASVSLSESTYTRPRASTPACVLESPATSCPTK